MIECHTNVRNSVFDIWNSLCLHKNVCFGLLMIRKTNYNDPVRNKHIALHFTLQQRDKCFWHMKRKVFFNVDLPYNLGNLVIDHYLSTQLIDWTASSNFVFLSHHFRNNQTHNYIMDDQMFHVRGHLLSLAKSRRQRFLVAVYYVGPNS